MKFVSLFVFTLTIHDFQIVLVRDMKYDLLTLDILRRSGLIISISQKGNPPPGDKVPIRRIRMYDDTSDGLVFMYRIIAVVHSRYGNEVLLGRCE